MFAREAIVLKVNSGSSSVNKSNSFNALWTLLFIVIMTLCHPFARITRGHVKSALFAIFYMRNDSFLIVEDSLMIISRFFISSIYLFPGTICTGGFYYRFVIVPLPIICASTEIVLAVARAMAVPSFFRSLTVVISY